MHEMPLMSFNVNQFAGMGEIKDTENLQELNSPAKQIIALVKEFLLKNDTGVVVLQEIPCWDFRLRRKRPIYDCFCAEFEEEIYEIIEPENIAAKIITLAVVRRNSGWKKETEGIVKQIEDFKNRLLELSNSGGQRLIGGHMPICPKNKKENEKFWRAICVYSKKEYGRLVGLTGDFNAHEGDCDYRAQYKAILDAGYQDTVPENAVTFVKGRRGIDHILVPAGDVFPQAMVFSVSFSDHAVIIADADIPSQIAAA